MEIGDAPARVIRFPSVRCGYDAVHDKGAGMAQHIAHRGFAPFARADLCGEFPVGFAQTGPFQKNAEALGGEVGLQLTRF